MLEGDPLRLPFVPLLVGVVSADLDVASACLVVVFTSAVDVVTVVALAVVFVVGTVGSVIATTVGSVGIVMAGSWYS